MFIVPVLVLAEELGGGLYDSEDDEDEEEDETDVEDASRPARRKDQADLVSWVMQGRALMGSCSQCR